MPVLLRPGLSGLSFLLFRMKAIPLSAGVSVDTTRHMRVTEPLSVDIIALDTG